MQLNLYNNIQTNNSEIEIFIKLINKNIQYFDELLLYYGITQKEITIIDGIIKIPLKGIVYIYGNSGSGKSYILNQIANKLQVSVKKINIEQFNNISLLLKDYISDLKLLAQFGFSDIPTLMTPVCYLSDGQKYRLFLLKELLQNDILILDEFCNPLDEFYTLSILKTLTKFKNEKLIIVATSRPYGYEYFDIDKVYHIKHGQIYEIKYQKKNLYDEFIIEPATLKDWQYFSRFHYRNKSPGIFNKAFKVKFKNQDIGIIITGLPYLNISIRNKLFPQYKNNFKLVNQEIIMIHRLVIIPEMRNLGVARFLILEIEKFYKNKGKKLIEIVSSLAEIIPFIQKAGFQYGGTFSNNPVKQLLEKLNFDFTKYLDKDYIKQFILQYEEQIKKAVQKSYNRGISSKLKIKDIEQLINYIQLSCYSNTHYFYKLLE